MEIVAFALISAGVYGWPRGDAIAAAIDTVAASEAQVREVTLVAFDDRTADELREYLRRAR